MSDARGLPGEMPCPAPLPEAVAAGIFGVMVDGFHCPDQDEVRAITEEHAQEMIALLADLTHLEWCHKHKLDPITERPARPALQARLAERLQREIVDLSRQYESCVTVYGDAFGCSASESLNAAVRRFVAGRFLKDSPPAVQRQLF